MEMPTRPGLTEATSGYKTSSPSLFRRLEFSLMGTTPVLLSQELRPELMTTQERYWNDFGLGGELTPRMSKGRSYSSAIV
jgi:hypothetical protein